MSHLQSKRILKFSFISIILINIILSAWWVINNNFYINFDISRDLILWYDIIHRNHITLIGPHSGTIPGLFHGPLWYYLNIPVLLISNGNPVVLGWFWILLSVAFLCSIFLIASRMFDEATAGLSVLVLSASSITNFIDDEKYFYNPYGAVILAPVFFFFFQKYIVGLRPIFLIFSIIFLGLIIQFQMAFGVPVLILTSVYLIIYTLKRKQLFHLSSLVLILIPLSTFVVFEFKNDFLQTQTLIHYITSENSKMSINSFIVSRFDQLFLDNFRMLAKDNFSLQALLSVSFFTSLFNQLRKDSLTFSKPIWLFSYFYFGYGVITFFFKGEIVNYYWPFLPLMVIFFCMMLQNYSKRLTATIILILVGYNLLLGVRIVTNYPYRVQEQDFTSWNYNLEMAQTVYIDANDNFGYFIYTPNLFGYSQRYAMEYASLNYKQIESTAFTKKPVTYLIIADSETGRPDLTPENWKTIDVKITSQPVKVLQFTHYKIEKYELTPEEINNPPNPSLLLLNNGFFR